MAAKIEWKHKVKGASILAYDGILIARGPLTIGERLAAFCLAGKRELLGDMTTSPVTAVLPVELVSGTKAHKVQTQNSLYLVL